jgi:hypothetical protein
MRLFAWLWGQIDGEQDLVLKTRWKVFRKSAGSGRNAGQRAVRPRKRGTRLVLETLEQRLVPTVVFDPATSTLTITGATNIIVYANDSDITGSADNAHFAVFRVGNGSPLSHITIAPDRGSPSSVTIKSLAADQSVGIMGTGLLDVTIGNTDGSPTNTGISQAVQGAVTIDNASADTNIAIEDTDDRTAQSFVIGTNAYDSNWGFVHEAALPHFSIDFRYGGTDDLTLYTGKATGNVVAVWQDGVGTTIAGNGPRLAVNVGNGNDGVQDIRAALTVTDEVAGDYRGYLTIDDTHDHSYNTARMAPDPDDSGVGDISGLAPADILYDYFFTSGLIINTTPQGEHLSVSEIGSPPSITDCK